MAQDDEFAGVNLDGDETPAKQPSYNPARPPRKSKKVLLALLIVIALTGFGWLGWRLTNHSKTVTPIKQAVAEPQQSTVISDTPASTNTKSYASETMALKLDYPSDWSLKVQTDNSIRIVSPSFAYKTTTGSSVDGNFRLYIRQTARPVDSGYIGRGLAIGPSQQVVYTKPTSTQRKSTYLTNFGLDNPNNFAYFFIAGNFNLNKGDSLGPNFGKEQGTFIIAGGYSADSLKDDIAMNMVGVDYYPTTNAYKQAVDIIKSLQLD